ncbi:MAG: lysostaphin resistance A-like protein [Armatimonadota bacterium]
METAALLATAAAAFYGVLFIAMRLGAAPPAGARPGWVDCLAMLVAASVPLAWEIGAGRASLRKIGFRAPRGGGRSAATTLALSGAFVLYAALLFALWRLRTPHLLSLGSFGPLAATCLCVATAEEVVFRGVVQRRLTAVCGAVPALVIAALVFAFLAHAHAPLAMNLVFRLPAGLLLGYAYHRHRSLVPPIALHWALNMAAVS